MSVAETTISRVMRHIRSKADPTNMKREIDYSALGKSGWTPAARKKRKANRLAKLRDE